MDCESVKTTWVGGCYPGLVPGAPDGSVGPVEGTEGKSRRAARRAPSVRKTIDLPGVVRKFFEENPDEELSATDAQVKFNASNQYVYKVLNQFCDLGWLRKRGHWPVTYVRAA